MVLKSADVGLSRAKVCEATFARESVRGDIEAVGVFDQAVSKPSPKLICAAVVVIHDVHPWRLRHVAEPQLGGAVVRGGRFGSGYQSWLWRWPDFWLLADCLRSKAAFAEQ